MRRSGGGVEEDAFFDVIAAVHALQDFAARIAGRGRVMEEFEELGAGGFLPVGQAVEPGLKVGEGEVFFFGLGLDEGKEGTYLVEVENGLHRGWRERWFGGGLSGGPDREGGSEPGTRLGEEAAAAGLRVGRRWDWEFGGFGGHGN